MIYLGNKKIDELYMGGGKISEAYLGSQLVYSAKKNGFTVTSSGTSLSYYLNSKKQTATVVKDKKTFIKIDDAITSMAEMFDSSTMYYLDLSKLETKDVKSMYNCFHYCTSLENLIINIDTSNVTNMYGTFSQCKKLKSLDLSSFDTSKVTTTAYMFYGSALLESLDLSNFDMTNVTATSDMFTLCTALTHIKCRQAFKDWCLANQDYILLPDAMRSGGSGTWEIVG